MKQILQSQRSGELWLAEGPVPACGGGGVVVRNRYSAISPGTEKAMLALARKSLVGKARERPDLVRQVVRKMRVEGVGSTVRQVLAKLDNPIPLGYSASGVVMEVGEGAGSFRAGDEVAIAGAGYATHAEFNYVPRNLCVRIPRGVSLSDAAFVAIGAVALQGVRQAQPMLGERVVVIGLGLIGLLTVQILKANGCAVLGVDIDQERASLATTLGADVAVSSDAEEAAQEFTRDRGADAVIVTAATSSDEPVRLAGEISRHKGRVVAVGLVGMQIPRDVYYHKELDLRLAMSYGPGRYDREYEERGNDYPFSYVRFTEQRNMESFLYLVQQGRVTPGAILTHSFPFSSALDAYALIEGKTSAADTADGRYIGIVLEYPEDASAERTVRRSLERQAAAGGNQVGVAFVGPGEFARNVLIPHLAKSTRTRLICVCASSGKSAQQTASRFKFETATTDIDEVLNHSGVDAVFIATRHDSHATLTAAALQAGKHVYVEKPLCISENELEQMEQALIDARSHGHEPCLMVGFNRRFSAHASALRAEFRDRRTPMALTYRVNAGRLPESSWIGQPDEGGGRIIGEVCHFVDFCGSLIECAPTAVTASGFGGPPTDSAVTDSAVVTIQYADGSLATIQYFAEGHRSLSKERCEVFCGGRSAVMENFRSTRFYGGGRPVRGPQAKGFGEELAAFLDTCTGGGRWPIPWQSIASTHRVCFGATRSLRSGVPVRMDEGSRGAERV